MGKRGAGWRSTRHAQILGVVALKKRGRHIFIVEDRPVVRSFREGTHVLYFTRSHNEMILAQSCIADWHSMTGLGCACAIFFSEPQICGRRSTGTARY